MQTRGHADDNRWGWRVTKTKAKERAPLTRPARLKDDEAYWAGLLSGFDRATIADVLSPMIRDRLRAALAKRGVDPDKAWADYEAGNRN
jgi:hypothetical protein